MSITSPDLRSYELFRVLIILFLISACTTPSILVTQEQQAGDQNFNQHNYPAAITHYSAMLEASLKLGVYRNLSMEADVHRKLANCFEMTGKYDDAESHVRQALVIDSLENNVLNIIEDHRMLGKIDLYKGMNLDAIKSFEIALELSEGMDQSLKNLNKNEIAENHLSLGQLYATMGRFTESLSNTGISLNLFKETNNKKGEMEALLTMATVYFNFGDLDLSRNLTLRSQSLAEGLGLSLSRHYNNLASISSTIGEYEAALRFAELALSSANANRIAAQRIWFTIRLGDIYRDLGDLNKSADYYLRAGILRDTLSLESESMDASLDLREGDYSSSQLYFLSQGSDVGTAISYLRMAELAIDKQDPQEALEYLEPSAELFRKTKNKPGLVNVSLQKGICHSLKEEYALALTQFDSTLMASEYPEFLWQAHYRKGLVYEELGELTKARISYLASVRTIEQIRGQLSIEEFKSSYLNNKVDVYDRLISLYIKINEPLSALEYTEKAKARSFFEMLANKRINNISPDDSLVVQEQEKRFEVQQLYKQLQSTESSSYYNTDNRDVNRIALTSELERKQEEYNDILIKLRLFNPDYSDIVACNLLSFEEIRSGLDEATAILSYWISDEEIHIWCILKENIVHKSMSISGEELTKTITDARTHIATNAISQANIELEKLYKTLLAPVEDQLEKIDNLIIIPNKSLHFLPFQALRSSSGRFVVNDYNISYDPCLNVYALKRKAETDNVPSLFGAALSDVAVGLNIGLPGTEDELNNILPMFQDNLSSFGAESTETFIKENIGQYNYVHLATHGIFNFEQPVYSFLLFPPDEGNDGRLTVHEVMSLKLNSRLVTLSACETGLGYLDRGDEIVGLSRSFLYAGASAVIVSLWSVADYQTSLLMTKFYSYISDYSLEEALAMAQREVMKEYPNPFFWSPFILIGKGN